MNLKYLLLNGKGSKPHYYAVRYAALLVPNFIYRLRRKMLLKKFEKLSAEEKESILDRVNYYCKLTPQSDFTTSDNSKIKTLAEHKLSNRKSRGYASVYFFDTYQYTRSLHKHLKWAYRFGDVSTNQPIPSITKSRPIGDDNQNSTILKLNKLRHFISVDDKLSFEEKSKVAVFRGDIRGKRCRIEFVTMFHDSTLCDTGDVGKTDLFAEWKKPKMTLQEQLQHKFIVALEGNDVASNLKWVMSSNSVAVMPRPRCETWFMEGQLIPNVHYIEVASDFSNFEERINYYLSHPEEAKQIAKNANQYWEQFRDKEREDMISHLVLQKYFTQTGQII